jgi:hypothetical protein
MAFEPPPKLEGAEGDIPDPILNVLKANIFADADV